ncbi:retrovirus-related pol polyprotein from transposon TNT 1-94 [Tanacetum coccineum]
MLEGSSKRAGTKLEQEVTKKQKVDDVQETAKVDNDQEAAKIKELMEIVHDKDEVAIDAIPLAENTFMEKSTYYRSVGMERIFKKKAKDDQTKHGMEKTKSIRSQTVCRLAGRGLRVVVYMSLKNRAITGKENEVNILKSIDEGPFQMGTFRETPAEGNEGALHLGPKRARVYFDLSPEDNESHYTEAKDIWDSIRCEDALGRMQLNSKFVNNILPEWGRFVTAVKPNRGLRDSDYDQLYAYLKQHEAHANENKKMLERSLNILVDTIEDRNNEQGVQVQAGYEELRTKFGNANTGGHDNAIDEDVDEQPIQDLALHVDNVFQADDCDAFDSDVDEAPMAQTMFMANLSSADPVYDEAGPSYDTDILSEEQVELYERRARFELTKREQKIHEQLRIVITDRNIKEENLKKELHSVKLQLASTINHNKSMVEEVTSLKKDFKQKENKYLKEFLDMKALKEKDYIKIEMQKPLSNKVKCGDPNHLIGECPKPPRDKNQREFVGGSWSDSGEEDDKKVNNKACLVAQTRNEYGFESSYFIDKLSSDSDEVGYVRYATKNLNQFIANDVWELVPQPKNMTIIGTKWVFRNKLDENDVVSRNKARLVAQGYNQQEGIDYDETYAPVARLESIRILLAYACALDFKLFQMDVKSSFLNGFINEEVYMAQPPGFIDFEKPDHVYKLKKALYGLKLAPKAWYDRLKAFLSKHEYKMGMVDNTLLY